MDPELDENGQVVPDSSTGNEDGSETTASPADGSENSDSPKEEEQTSLEAMTEALSADDDEEGGEKESGKQDVKTDEAKKDEAKPDDAAGNDSDKTKAEELSDDALLEPLPDGTPVKTAERFEKLTEGFKDLKEKHETLTTESEAYKKYHDDFQSIVQHSGATPNEFNDLIEYSHLVKSGNLEGALAMLDAQRAGLATAMGKPLPGVNLFHGHQDLQDKIDNHELTEELAGEIVKTRNADALRVKQEDELRAQEKAQHDQQQVDNNFNQTIENAQADVMSMVSSWEKNDINFSAKQAAIVKKVEEIGQKYPPEQWAEILQLNYDAIKVDSKPKIGNQHTPLRPGSNGGGGTKTPTSSLDAISQALS